MRLTKQQKQLRRTINLLNELAGFFEDVGLEDLAVPLDEAHDRVEDIALRLEELGLPAGVVA